MGYPFKNLPQSHLSAPSFIQVRAVVVALSAKLPQPHFSARTLFLPYLMAKREITRADILRLAAEAQLDPRTVQRAVERGIGKMQAAVDKERIRAAAAKLKITIE